MENMVQVSVEEFAFTLLQNIGPENIYKHVDILNEEIIKNTSDMGITNISRNFRAKHYLGLRFEKEIPNNFIDNLDGEILREINSII